jgi:nitrite reductase (NADH) small subunit
MTTTKTTRLLVAHLSDIDVRSSRTVQVQGNEIALFRLTDGSVHAIDNKCPHKGGVLSEGMVCGSYIHCPLHDMKINLRTGKAEEPDDGCVTTYDVEIDSASGGVYLNL